ncbi:Ig-like domain-containing protein [Spirochaetota bacterium]
MKNNIFLLFISAVVISFSLIGLACDDCDSCVDKSPTVASTTPANGATDVSVATTISITFSEPMDVTTITHNNGSSDCNGSIQILDDPPSAGCRAIFSMTISNLNKTYTLVTSLGNSNTYVIKVTTDVKDSSNGNAMVEEFTSSFTTEPI